jgi:hypothetical protein
MRFKNIIDKKYRNHNNSKISCLFTQKTAASNGPIVPDSDDYNR